VEIRSSLADSLGEPCVAGQRWTWDGVAFEVMHPSAEAYAVDGKPNHVSCVLRLTLAVVA
jgi:competence protein ComEC